MKKEMLFISLFFLLSPALAFTFTVVPVTDSAIPGGQVSFKINVTNNDTADEEINLATLLSSKYEHEFLPSDTIKPAINESILVTLNFKIPIKDQASFSYLVPVDIIFYSRKTHQREEARTYATVLPGSYLAGFTFSDIIIPQSVDPRQEFIASFSIDNALVSDYNVQINYRLIDSSNKTAFEKKNIQMLIKAGQLNEYILPIKINEQQKPGVYLFTVEAYVQNNLIGRKSKALEVRAYDNIVSSSDEEVNIFSKTIHYTYLNNGTQITDFVSETPLSFLEFIFVYYSSPDKYYENGKLKYDLSLKPGETKDIIIQVTYVPFLLLPFLMFGLFYAYYQLTRKLVISKVLLEQEMEGGSLLAKLEITIKNLSRKPLSTVKIIEELPLFVTGVGGFTTLKPEVKNERNLEWTIEHLSPREERIMTYKIKTKIGIIGAVSLPSTKVAFKDYKGMKYEVLSNPITFETSFIEEQQKKKK